MVQYQLPNDVFDYYSQLIWAFRSRSPIRPSFHMQGHCGKLITQSFLSSDRAMVQYELPLAEIATEFHDRLKTLSSGYASFDYEPAGHQVCVYLCMYL